MIRPIGNKAAITFDQLKMAEKQMDPSLKSFLVKIDLGQTSGKEKMKYSQFRKMLPR